MNYHGLETAPTGRTKLHSPTCLPFRKILCMV